jgi:hypothetical protein
MLLPSHSHGCPAIENTPARPILLPSNLYLLVNDFKVNNLHEATFQWLSFYPMLSLIDEVQAQGQSENRSQSALQ